jgi:hypothetical protein
MTPEKPAEIGKLIMVLNVTEKVGSICKTFPCKSSKARPTLSMK